HVFHLNPSVLALGYGGNTDTPLAYIHTLMLLLIAAASAIVWSLLDRKHLEYRSLHAWVRLLVRYSVASSLLWYGFMKIFVKQFSPGSIYMSRLVDPIGNMSPIGLLWLSVGYSTPYQLCRSCRSHRSNAVAVSSHHHVGIARFRSGCC